MENWRSVIPERTNAGGAAPAPLWKGSGCSRIATEGSPSGIPGVPVGAGLCPRPLSRGDGDCKRIRRGRPVCRPAGGSREEVCPGGHIGPPLRGGEGVPNQRKIGAKTDLANGAGRSPPPTGGRGSSGNHLGQRRTAERLRRGREEWVKIGSWIIPKVSINAGQSLSHGEAVTAPFAQGSLRDGGYGLPRRFAPRNDSPDPLSFRGGPTG